MRARRTHTFAAQLKADAAALDDYLSWIEPVKVVTLAATG
jgi:hypothetical protein